MKINSFSCNTHKEIKKNYLHDFNEWINDIAYCVGIVIALLMSYSQMGYNDIAV